MFMRRIHIQGYQHLQYNNVESLRKETAIEVARTDRMRQEDAQSYSKAKNIINLINDNFFSKID